MGKRKGLSKQPWRRTRMDELKKAVMDALDELFSLSSVPQSETKSALEEIRDEIDIKISTLDTDDMPEDDDEG